MNNRLVLLATIFVSAALFSTLQAQQLTLKATGNGTLTDSDGSYAASFQMFDDGVSISFIEISAPAVMQSKMRISISGFGNGGRTASGTFTPCDGGTCPCTLEVNEAQSNLSGTCTNPEQETLRLSFPGFRSL